MTDRLMVPHKTIAVFKMLQSAAEAGTPCPTNEQIICRIGDESVSSGARQIALLETAGLIAVTRFRSGRQIEIVGTGKKTAAIGGAAISFDRHRRSALDARREIDPGVINTFAEAIADGMTISNASREAGVSSRQGTMLMARLRADLGEQAI